LTTSQRTTLGCRAFSVAGPTVWNSLPDRDETENTFQQSLKHCFSDNISVLSALEVLMTMCCVNRPFTYLLDTNTALKVNRRSD